MAQQLAIHNLKIVYRKDPDAPGFLAVNGLDLSVDRGEFVTIVGPSGCGKSTLLLAIDGLIPVEAGEIAVGGRQVAGPGPDRAMVFQEFGLFPWLTVEDNILFAMQLRRRGGASSREIARQYVQRVGLSGFERSYPRQLSGGMRQRVGLARALAVEPEILLMDEPFGALDAQTRELMGAELLTLWNRDRKTVLFVTHGIDEAVYLADRVVVMSRSPGMVKEIIPIALSRPRELAIKDTPRFATYRRHIWDLLEDEVRNSAAWKGVAT